MHCKIVLKPECKHTAKCLAYKQTKVYIFVAYLNKPQHYSGIVNWGFEANNIDWGYE